MQPDVPLVYESLFERAPDGLIALDGSGLVAHVNRRAEVLLGRPRSDLIGRSPAGALTEPGRAAYAALLAAPPATPVELAVRREGGEEVVVEATACHPGEGAGALLALRDVSERKRRDEERVRERQMVRAEQMAAIGQVAAGVAHELRNPLTSIKGLVQVNLREADARGVPAEDLRVIEHEVRRMERSLQTFLDFARPPRPDRRRLDLSVVVDRVYDLVGGRARKQQVRIRFSRPDGPVCVDGDQDQLQQLLLNLVLNALDAMPHGGTVETTLRAPRGGHVELLVRDTGPGIAAHILPKVFETFVSSKETGVGLGLPVSRRIADDHGGTLSAHNPAGGGACFALRLPAPT